MNPSGAGGWSNWSKVEGFTVKEVTVAQNADGRLEAFVIESDGDLWHRWQLNPSGAGGWSNWSKIEGFTVKEVTVAQNADGRLEAFAIESDGDLWHRWQLNPSGVGGWSNWSKIEGFTVKDVQVAQNADGRLEAFVVESDRDFWHRWQLNPSGVGGWSNWSKIEGLRISEEEGNGNVNTSFESINSEAEYKKRLYGSSSGAVITQNADDHGGPIDSWKGLGSDLYALVGGEVIEARNGINYGNNSCNLNNWKNNGTVAIYNSQLDKTFIYWHLQEGSIDEDMEGQTIATGSFIGKEGKTGYACGVTGVHTHIEVHQGRVNFNMNPSQFQYPYNSQKLHLPSVLGDGSW